MLTHVRLRRFDDAIACFKRALEADAPHPMTVFLRLAQLLITTGDHAGAAGYAQAAVAQGEAHAHPVEYYAKALVAVAEYQVRQPGGDWGRACEYLERVAASPAPTPDDPTHVKAVELLKLVKTKLQMRAASGLD
jgi:tetratricopeptide (TPR) repeat protein